MVETYADFFNELLFGAGAWLGFLLIVAIAILLILAWKYAGILTFFVSIFIAVAYIEHDLLYHSLGMFILAVFSLLMLIRKHD